MLAADPGRPITDLLLLVGRRLPAVDDARGYLIVEALVAARRDEDVARPMRDYVGERGDWLAELVRAAQAGGELDPALSPDALAHFCLLLAMGSALVTPDLHAVAEEEWAALLTRVIAGLAPAADHRTDRNIAVKVQINPGSARGTAAAMTSPPACSETTTRATGRSSATAPCRRRRSATRAWPPSTVPSTRSNWSRRADMAIDDRFTRSSRETGERRDTRHPQRDHHRPGPRLGDRLLPP